MSKILTFPDPILRKFSLEINEFGAKIQSLSENLLKTMQVYGGIGLAAPQMGILQRIFVMDLKDINSDMPKTFINPKIEKTCDEITYEEGCLSIPNIRANVIRKKYISVSYQDLNGQQKILEVENLTAICIQHEIDHLNGILFLDHLSPIERKILVDKYKKQK